MSNLLEQASLVLIPSGYAEDIVYSEIPLDGSGDMVFSRSSNGTRINSAGLVEVCPWNLVEQSETFDNVVWEKDQLTITANTTTAPNGTLTADTLTILTASGHLLRQVVSVIPNSVYTFSFYIKRGTATALSYSIYDVTNSSDIVASTSYYSQTSSSQWTRISVSFTTPSGCVQIGCYPSRDSSSTGTAFIWGAQLNIGSTAKPYFPTTDRLNVPRLTYQNGGGGCPSLLLEKQSTNLVVQSQALSGSPWVIQTGSILDNNTISPDGTQNASKLTDITVYEGMSVDIGATYTATMYAKLGTATNICLVINNQAAWNTVGGVSFTTSNGLIANEWARVQFTFTAPATGAINLHIGGHGQTGVTPQSAGTVFVWGVQIEKSSYPTSYIPTTSASATRVADYPSRSGLALTNFTFAVNFKPLAYVVELFDFEKTGGGRMFYIAVQSNGFITFNSVSGGTIGAIGSVLTINQTCKLAFKLNASTSNLTVFINGSNIGTYTTNITTFGAFFGLQSFGYNPGTQIEQIAIFPSVLTDAECISLTTI